MLLAPVNCAIWRMTTWPVSSMPEAETVNILMPREAARRGAAAEAGPSSACGVVGGVGGRVGADDDQARGGIGAPLEPVERGGQAGLHVLGGIAALDGL